MYEIMQIAIIIVFSILLKVSWAFFNFRWSPLKAQTTNIITQTMVIVSHLYKSALCNALCNYLTLGNRLLEWCLIILRVSYSLLFLPTTVVIVEYCR